MGSFNYNLTLGDDQPNASCRQGVVNAAAEKESLIGPLRYIPRDVHSTRLSGPGEGQLPVRV